MKGTKEEEIRISNLSVIFKGVKTPLLQLFASND